MDLYIATDGRDSWQGNIPAPNKDKTNGPLASLKGAKDRVKELKGILPSNKHPVKTVACSEPVTVWVRGGRYEMAEPMVFTHDDSYPVTFAAYKNEKPVFDGGVKIDGWTTTKINGRTAWRAELPDVAAGKFNFRELFVNGRRAQRPRFPAKGLFRMDAAPDMPPGGGRTARGQTRFVAAPGNLKPFANVHDVEAVYVHFWIEERSHLASIDLETRMVTMARPSHSGLVGAHGSELADYYFDNVFEELKTPGQWYLDRPNGVLYYLPRRGETPENTEIYAPRCFQLIALTGNPDENRYVEFIRFQGLVFRHTDWRHPSDDGAAVIGSSDPGRTPALFSRRHSRGNKAAAAQAACDVPGIITFEGARNCAVENCVIELGGWYGVEIGAGCSSIRVAGNTIRALGAGGVKINGAAARDKMPNLQTGLCVISDNEIRECGRIFHSAVGVLSMNAFGMVISHNHIHDLFYTGISCGWEWGYQESVSRDNLIEKNHIHKIGQGLLSDMGGIYTLGVQPGTVIRGNHIYDVHSAHYGGWCIYPDEGSSHMIIENNLCYDADRQAFHQHYGRENIVRNNIFAFGGDSAAHYSRMDEHNGITFTNNIFITDGKPFYSTGYAGNSPEKRFYADLNFFFDVSGKPACFLKPHGKTVSFRQWRMMGMDMHSLEGNPRFANLGKRDFRLMKNSPVFKVGFIPFSVKDAGPRRAK